MGTTVSTLLTDLQSGRTRLFASIRGLTEEQFRFTPSSEAWPIAAHLAHLQRTEAIYADRALAALAEDQPFVASTRTNNHDDPGLAQHLAVPQMIHGMLNTRRSLEAFLSACTDGDLARAIRHETLGPMTIEQIAVKMHAHELEHAMAIEQLVKRAPPSARVIIPLAQRS
jgi:uncharacterized damage-inducible protein DinB